MMALCAAQGIHHLVVQKREEFHLQAERQVTYLCQIDRSIVSQAKIFRACFLWRR